MIAPLLLCGLAFAAGFVDAIAGSGGLIQLPALFLWLPPDLAARAAPVLGTNKFSSICGTSMAAVQYARRVPLSGRVLWPAAGCALVFSLLGARTVTLIQPQVLKPLVWLLLLAVAVYTFVRKDFGDLPGPRLSPHAERLAGFLAGAAIGFYDGFFGPGTGSFLIFVFIGWFGFDFLAASASAKFVNFATNLSAVAYFASTDNILYRYAVPMGLCNVLGSLLGARLAIWKGNRFVRAFFLVVVSGMIVRFGWDLLR